MQEVKINKTSLLKKVEENREKHIGEYNEAVVGYKKAAIEKIEEITNDLKDKIHRLKDDEFITLQAISFNLPAPKSFEEEYNQIIEMLKMSVDNEITLTHHEFRQYVMDLFDWTEAFKISNIRYTKK